MEYNIILTNITLLVEYVDILCAKPKAIFTFETCLFLYILNTSNPSQLLILIRNYLNDGV